MDQEVCWTALALAAGVLLFSRRRALKADTVTAGTPQNSVDIATKPHPQDLYDYDEMAAGIKGWVELFDAKTGEVKCEHLKTFREEGLLVIENAFDEEEIRGAFDAVSKICLQENTEFEAEVASQPAVLDFTSGIKWALCQWESGTDMRETPSDREKKVRKLMGFCKFDERLKLFSEHPQLLQLSKELLGSDSDPSDLELFQDMALLKPPGGREKPWHQDSAYFNVDTLSKECPVLGVWIAMDEATPDNGCMRMLAGGHKRGPCHHFQQRDYQICDTDAMLEEHKQRRSIDKAPDQERVVCVPLQPGSFVIFVSRALRVARR
jgi:phytanoyl-CoA hydroxylase